MRYLILDDEDHRHQLFETVLGQGCVHAYRFKEFQSALAACTPQTCILLDHDLDLLMDSDQDENGVDFTGLDAARLVVALPIHARPRLVLVHSLNDEGAEEMVRVLREARIPVIRRAFDRSMWLEDVMEGA